MMSNLSIQKLLKWGLNKIPLYTYQRAYRQSRSEFQRKNQKNLAPVIVYQTGRVGSRSIESMLEEYYHDSVVLHAHYLNPAEFRHHLEHDIRLGLAQQSATVKQARFDLQLDLLKHDFEDQWKVVTLTRDPAAIVLSSFSLHCFHFQPDIVKMAKENGDEDIIHAQIKSLFQQEQAYLFDKTARWFDEELLKVFSINILDQEFPVEKGYDIYRADRASVLLIRLEDLNRCYREAFQEFLGIQVESLRKDNSAAQLGYDELYRHIRQAVCLSDEYLQRLYDIPWVRHCYSSQEIEDFKKKWM